MGTEGPKLEITESVIMRECVIVPKLRMLSSRGIPDRNRRFRHRALDAVYLQHFPVDTLKIDRAFVSAFAARARN